MLLNDYNRSWVLIVNALLLAHVLNWKTRAARLLGAGGLGLLAVVLELYTTDQGLYSLAASVAVLMLFAGLGWWKGIVGLYPARYYLEMLGVLFGFFILGNLLVSLFFKLTSPNYQGFFDFQVLSLEEVRSYNYTQGVPWKFPAGATFVVAVIFSYICWFILRHAFKLPLQVFYLLVSLLIFALMTFKSAMIRSDVGHIALGLTPLVFLFLILGASSWEIQPATTFGPTNTSRIGQGKIRWGWLVLLVALFATWPISTLESLTNLGSTLDGHIPVFTKLKQARDQNTPPNKIVPADLLAAIRPNADLLVFPYDNYLAIGLRQPLVAPVLQAYAASTIQLQRTYVAQVERRKSNLEVIYGLDGLGVGALDGVQYVTRLPLIFEEFYQYFTLKTPAILGKGMLVLKPRPQPVSPKDMRSDVLRFNVEPKNNGELIVRFSAKANCSLLRLTSQLNYPITALLGRPTPLNMVFFDGKTAWLGARFVSAEPGKTLSTYIQLVAPTDFAKVFGTQPVPTRRLDAIQITQVKSDLLDVAPSSFELSKIECVTFAR